MHLPLTDREIEDARFRADMNRQQVPSGPVQGGVLCWLFVRPFSFEESLRNATIAAGIAAVIWIIIPAAWRLAGWWGIAAVCVQGVVCGLTAWAIMAIAKKEEPAPEDEDPDRALDAEVEKTAIDMAGADAEDEIGGPYLLHGEELDRAERFAKAGYPR